MDWIMALVCSLVTIGVSTFAYHCGKHDGINIAPRIWVERAEMIKEMSKLTITTEEPVDESKFKEESLL